MSIIKGESFCTIDELGFEALYAHDRGTEDLIVKDDLIIEATVAVERAKSELVKNGYREVKVSIQSTHIVNLTQNELINFQGKVWIIKELSLSFQPPVLIQTIKGVRYE